MRTLKKLPIARPSRAKAAMPAISTGVYCGRVGASKSIVPGFHCWWPLSLSVRVPIIGIKQSWRRVGLSPFLKRLPAQERIGDVIYYIPDVGRLSLVQSNRDYVPACG